MEGDMREREEKERKKKLWDEERKYLFKEETNTYI